ncbi:hypothetical protein DWV00_27745 [Trinickia dinghuensis]|uniref:Uncharacterized protein n=1 Tax=Trinickia dinghuensis TaxID=2291023 RepID=A0A3D8JSJ9_9BURK|nr:hypothetical protein DWV00_27745 [Trinickia dinghuensis]
MCIARDPNWDDQVLLVGGRAAEKARCLRPGASTSFGIRLGADTEPDENLMGVIFGDGKVFGFGMKFDYENAGAYQSTLGHHPDTGLLAVTDETKLGTPSFKYSVTDQTQWSMKMTFEDA